MYNSDGQGVWWLEENCETAMGQPWWRRFTICLWPLKQELQNKQNDSNKWNQKLFWKSSCVYYTFELITDAGFFSLPACRSQHYGTHVEGEAHGSAVYIHHGCTLQWDQSKQYFWIFQIQIKDLSFLAIASSWLHSCLLLPARAAPSPPNWLMPEFKSVANFTDHSRAPSLWHFI